MIAISVGKKAAWKTLMLQSATTGHQQLSHMKPAELSVSQPPKETQKHC